MFSILEDKARQHKIGFAKDEDSVDAAPYDYSIEVGMFEIYNDEGMYSIVSRRLT